MSDEGKWICGAGCNASFTSGDAARAHMKKVPHPLAHGTHPISAWCQRCPEDLETTRRKLMAPAAIAERKAWGWVE